MDIHPTYNCLLGRSCIHEAGVMTSTLHQKLKFVKKGKLVVFGGEKALLVSHLSSFAAPMSSLKDAQEAIQVGSIDKWGRVVQVAENKNRARLGFQPGSFNAKAKDENDDEEISNELSHLLEHEEKTIQPFEEQIELVNLGSEDDVKEVKIGSQLCPEAKKGLITLLREYSDVFSWSYQDMPELDSEIVEHRFPLKPEYPLVKQKMRRTHPDMAIKIKEEVKKKIDVGFLVTSEYPQWVSNIVLVPKKDGKVRMCVNYKDLSKTSLKDDFPLSHIDMFEDNTAKFKVFSFMDGFSGYNQIKMAPEDMEKTTYYTLGNILL
ncbi:hypothetical protein KIW84_022471 [Lathyrus oleraceus]|uniref:Reverse transcriptase domain-containing protein n=1 Tax=Pisum sativum TaxID=3888 RepID=A0A9D5BAT0_PEA|nr:hypothetical protein KIW84_022471 [Pisum sativum]